MTIIILNGKKAAVISYGQWISYIDILDNYIKWLIISTEWLRPTQKATFFFNLLQYYNFICPNLSWLDIFMMRWWWRNSQWCKLTLAQRFWVTKVVLWASKITKTCLLGCPTRQATSWNENFENYSRYSLIK